MQTLKDELRNRILIEAKNAFQMKGFEKTSMREIADASDITVGNIYRYYKNKNELFYAVVKDAHEAITHIVKADHSESANHMTSGSETNVGLLQNDPTLREIIDVFVMYKTEITILVHKSQGSELGMMIKKFRNMIVDKIYNQIFQGIHSETIDLRLLSSSLANTCIEGITEICNSDMDDEAMYRSIYGLLMFLFIGAEQRVSQIGTVLGGGHYD